MKTILIIGKNGLLSTAIQKSFNEFALNTFAKLKVLGSDELDITDFAAVTSYFKKNHSIFSAVVNCAGYTDVDKANKNKVETDKCYKLNTEAPLHLVKELDKYNVPVILFSSDFVTEPNRLNRGIYAQSKVFLEERLSVYNTGVKVFRFGYPWDYTGKTMYSTFNDIGKANNGLAQAIDVLITPTYLPDLAHDVLCTCMTTYESIPKNKVTISNFNSVNDEPITLTNWILENVPSVSTVKAVEQHKILAVKRPKVSALYMNN